MRTYLSGYPAINHDTEDIFAEDLARGEAIAVPIALLVMIFMFGTLGGIFVPVVFALVTIPTTLGFVWIFANLMEMAIYVTNIVALIGLAIAVDYSMLVVFRYREELAHTEDPYEALKTTMATAGRATLFSGMVVAIGLALLVFMPLPFMRSMGDRRHARAAGLDRRLRDAAAGDAGDPRPRREPLPRDPRARARAPRAEGRHGRLAPARDVDHAPARAVVRGRRRAAAGARGARDRARR